MTVKSKRRVNRLKNSDDVWLKANFEWLVDNFAGQYVVVAEGEPFIGYDVAELERKALSKYPGVITTGMPIPRPEDFLSVL